MPPSKICRASRHITQPVSRTLQLSTEHTKGLPRGGRLKSAEDDVCVDSDGNKQILQQEGRTCWMGEERKEGVAERASFREQCMAQDGVGAVRARWADNRCERLYGRHSRICSCGRAAAAQHPHQCRGPLHCMHKTSLNQLRAASCRQRRQLAQAKLQSHPRPSASMMSFAEHVDKFVQDSILEAAVGCAPMGLRTGRFARGRLTWPCGQRRQCQSRRAGSAHRGRQLSAQRRRAAAPRGPAPSARRLAPTAASADAASLPQHAHGRTSLPQRCAALPLP